MEAKILEALDSANDRLRRGKLGTIIYPRGDRLWLRGTFPPKPYLAGKSKPYQQMLCLHLPFNLAGIFEAERRAKLIGGQLIAGKFNWLDWIEEPEKRETVAAWLKRFELNYWAKHKRTQAAQNTWKSDYWAIFKKLPSTAPLALDLLLETAIALEPDSRQRKRACEVLTRLAKFAGLPTEALAELKGDYSLTAVKPRDLPSDAEIVRVRDRLISRRRPKGKPDGWLWIYGAIAAYGLRPHEVFHADLRDFPTLRVHNSAKTGERFVFPLYPEWAEEWNLKNKVLPNLKNIEILDNSKLGNKIAEWFRDLKIPFPAYHLRHCYARRCFESGLSSDFGAKLMGHSTSLHEKVYRAWIDEAVYRQIYDLVMSRNDRPSPPN